MMMPLVMVNLFDEKERNERTYFYVVSHLLDILTIDATMVYLFMSIGYMICVLILWVSQDKKDVRTWLFLNVQMHWRL